MNKKPVLFALLFFVFSAKIFSQDSLSKWKVQLYFGIEEHDKRLFNYSEKWTLLSMQPERWGTYSVKAEVERKLLSKWIFTLYSGFGLQYELATFLRPFDHFYFSDGRTIYILWHEDRYNKIGVLTNTRLTTKIISNVYFDMEVYPVFNIFRLIDNSAIKDRKYFPYKKWEFEFVKIQANAGLCLQYKRVAIGFYYRFYNYQKIDKIIFNKILKDPRTDQTWEYFNPVHYDFSIAYSW